MRKSRRSAVSGIVSAKRARGSSRREGATSTMHAFFKPVAEAPADRRSLLAKNATPSASIDHIVAKLRAWKEEKPNELHSSDSSSVPSPPSTEPSCPSTPMKKLQSMTENHSFTKQERPSLQKPSSPVASQLLVDGLAVVNGVLALGIPPRSRGLAPLCCVKCGAPTVPLAEGRQTRRQRQSSALGVSESDTPSTPTPDASSQVASVEAPASTAVHPKNLFRSRLSRRKVQESSERIPSMPPERPPIKVRIVFKKPPSNVIDLSNESPKRPIRTCAAKSSPKRRRKTPSADVSSIPDTPLALPDHSKLHSFFKATQKAVATKKSEPGPRNVCTVAAHPWTSPWATVHVNGPFLGEEWKERWFQNSGIIDGLETDWSCLAELCQMPVKSVEEKVATEALAEPPNYSVEGCVTTWAELYKDFEKIDRFNLSAISSLVDWLRGWYRGGTGKAHESSECDESYTSEFSEYATDSELRQMGDVERVSILTGPPGCGKSTVVKIAARQLGLSVLEINQSVCRKGQKVKDIVGEALKSHRVTSNVHKFAFGKEGPASGADQSTQGKHPPRTLILFEEVDELHEDERGFWTTLRELASDPNCMRPIVCTANKFSVYMQGVFGTPQLPEEDADISRLLSHETPEEFLNSLRFKHIQLEMRTPRQVCSVLKMVAERENLQHNKGILASISRSARVGDIRHAVNALQFWAIPSTVSPFPTVMHSIHKSAQLFCTSSLTPSELAPGLTLQERLHDDGRHSVLQSVYRTVSKRASSFKEHDAAVERSTVAALADALDSFCVADTVLTATRARDVDMQYASMDDLQIEAEGFSGCDGAKDIASDIHAWALAGLATPLAVAHSDRVGTEAAMDFGLVDETWFPKLGNTALLARRSAVVETVPALRAMLFTARRVCERNVADEVRRNLHQTRLFPTLPLPATRRIMKVVAFTESMADLRVRYQVVHMDSSAFVWADATSPASSGKTGSLGSLALTMPARSADDAPPTAVVLPGPSSATSRRLAEKITRRTGLVVHAHVSIPADADALGDRIALRLIEELQRES